MGNVSREVVILRKNQKEMIRNLKKRKTAPEIKKAFNGLIADWTLLRKKISELEDISIEASKTEKQREKRQKN